MKLSTLLTCTLMLLTPAAALAAGNLQITEAYVGLSGPDGTEDWFELTNIGDMPISTDGLFYDDESGDPTVDAPLDAFLLGPGESAVFLIEGDAAAIADFEAIWGTGINVGVAAGGGGLGQGGDGIFIFDSNIAGPSTNVITSVAFDAGSVPTSTIEIIPGGPNGSSILGVNGAYESASFVNDNFPNSSVTLVGSPGIGVPEPTAAVLAALAACGLAARRV